MAGDEGWTRELLTKASLINAMTIRVAATLRLADHVAAGQTTAPALATVTNADADALERVLRHLVTLGILRAGDTGEFALTELGEHLRGDSPDGVRPWLDLHGPFGSADLSMIHLLHTVLTGEPAFPQQYGQTFWERLSGNPDLSAKFDAALGSAPFEADLVPQSYDWASLGHVVDVGGGNGTLLIALLRKHAELTATLLDLPGPAHNARRNLQEAGVADRVEIVTGSFFSPLPPGAGGYILSAILHDWNDQSAREILHRCAEAAHPSGKVLVLESLGDNTYSPFTEMDLRMLAYMGGRERTLDQLTTLATAAGLTVGSVSHIGYRSIVELVSNSRPAAPATDLPG